MVLLKGKTSLGSTRLTEGSGITTRSKFKVYSERKNGNRRNSDDADSKPPKTALVLESRTGLASNTGTNKAKVSASGADLTTISQDSLDKTKARRKALADVSNIQGHSSRFEKSRSSLLSFGTTIASSRKSIAGNTLCSKPKEGFGTRKYVTKTSKFKVYSARQNVNCPISDDADSQSLRTSIVLENMTQLASDTTVNKASSGASVAELTKSSNDSLDKTKAQRKTLADVSNIWGHLYRFEKPRSSLTFGPASDSSSQSLAGKSKAKLSRGAVASNTSGKATVNTKALRTSSNLRRDPINEIGFAYRKTSKSSNTIMRKSFPVLKRASHLASSDMQVSVRSAEKSARKVGFPVKSRAGGKLVTQQNNLKGRVLMGKDDGFIAKAMKNQITKDALGGVRNSVKPIARTNVRTSSGQKNLKYARNGSLDKAHGHISTRSAKLVTKFAERSEPTGSFVEVTESRNPVQGSDKIKPESSETIVSKNSGRRKSYTSSLISRAKVLESRNEVREPDELPNIDDEDNPLEVAEYVDDIYEYYWIMEAECAPVENYLRIQTDVTPQMRGLLINWLIEVHHKFELMPETLYLTVALLDKYLTIVPIKRKELQLVGLVSLLLASKYEDFWHPLVKELIGISAELYTREQVLEMEKNILRKLKFRLNLPTAYVFMRRFLKASQSDKRHEHLAFYLIELCLVEYGTLKFRPSLLCASAVYLARCTLNEVPTWTALLEKHARYEEIQLRDCAEMILQIHKAACASLLKVTYDKYMQPKLGRVAAIKPLDSLPH